MLFAGPGVAIAAGIPSRDQLLATLIARADAAGAGEAILAEMKDLAARAQIIDALSAAKQALGPGDFGAAVERELDDQGIDALPDLALAIGELRGGIRAALTTNLDGLLERAFGGAWPAISRATADLAQRRRFILKLHGTLVDRSTWVLTREEYDRAMLVDERLKQAFAALFNACTLLFVGYQPGDDDLEAVLARVRAFAGDQPPRHFALLPAAAMTPYRRGLLAQAGVRAIAVDDGDGAARVLRDLAREIDDGPPASEGDACPIFGGAARSAVELGCPFPGLAFFDQDRARFFFGRSAEIAEAVQKLGDSPEGHRRWLQVEGASGAGKSSLARAGLVPAVVVKGWVAGAPRAWRVAVFRPGSDPVVALAAAVHAALKDRLPEGVSLDATVASLRASDDALGAFLREHAPAGHGFLLLADQLEEAFSLAGAAPRAQLDALLARAVRDAGGPLYLITTLRIDFAGRLHELPALEAILNAEASRYHLKTMRGPGLRAAIEGPAKVAGLVWEHGLPERILESADASEGGLPLVAHVLQALWARRDGQTLRHAAYDALGGVGGALSQSADAIVDGLGPEGRARVRRLFLRLVKIGRGAPDARQTATRDQALEAAGGGAEAERILGRLSGGRDPKRPESAMTPARLLMVGGREGEAGEDQVEIVHEALIRQWKTLRNWIAESRHAMERRDDLEAAAQVWEAAGAPPDDLPSGAQLAYLRGAEGYSDRGRRYLDAADRRERRRVRRARIVIAALAAGVVAFGGIAAYALKQRQEVAAQRDLAQRRLDDAIGLTDEVNLTVERQLGAIPAAADAQKSLLLQVTDLQAKLLAGASSSKEALHGRVMLSVNQGDLALRWSDPALAKDRYAGAAVSAGRLAEAFPGTIDAYRDMAMTHRKLGEISLTLNDVATARAELDIARGFAEVLAGVDPKQPDLKRELAGCYLGLSEVAKRSNDAAALRDLRDRMIKLQITPTETDLSTPESAASYLGYEDHLADFALADRDLATALDADRRRIKVREDLLTRQSGHTGVRRDLAMSYAHLGDVHEAGGDHAAAREAYAREIDLLPALLAAEPGEILWDLLLAEAHASLAVVAAKMKDPGALRVHRDEALRIVDRAEKSGRLKNTIRVDQVRARLAALGP